MHMPWSPLQLACRQRKVNINVDGKKLIKGKKNDDQKMIHVKLDFISYTLYTGKINMIVDGKK